MFVVLLAGVSVAANISRESWFLFFAATLSAALGWIVFKGIWSKHGEDKDANREIWRVERWAWGIGITALIVFWLRSLFQN